MELDDKFLKFSVSTVQSSSGKRLRALRVSEFAAKFPFKISMQDGFERAIRNSICLRVHAAKPRFPVELW